MKAGKVSVKRVVDDKLCLGCGLCTATNDGLRMELAANGFLEPVADSPERLAEALAGSICPAVGLSQNAPKSGIETLYGPLLEPVQTAHASESEVRRKASSGGSITAVLLYLLEHKVIDGVLQVGKDLADPTRNTVFLSRTREDVIRNCGSRYAPSSLLARLPAALEESSRLAVVGKPCDIAGVRNYLENRPADRAKVVITISFMCMGLPSYNATRQLLRELNRDEEPVTDFWYRGNGWPGEMTVCTEKNRYRCSYEFAWQTLGRATPFRCKICPDGFGEFADFSAGDAWFVKNSGPSFGNESDGRSFIFIRTPVGQRHVTAAASAGYLVIEGYDIQEMMLIQRYQVLRKIYAGIRYYLLKKLRCHYLDFQGMCLLRNLRFATPRVVIGEIRGFLIRFREHYL